MVRNGLRFVLAVCMFVAPCLAQKDPGVRKDAAGAGSQLSGLTPIELGMFNEGQQRAIQLEAVCDDCSDLKLGSYISPLKAKFVTQTNSSGLGTRFNGDQCLACHNQPELGGSGFMVPNPQDPPEPSASRKTRCSISYPIAKARPPGAVVYPAVWPDHRSAIHEKA
jgi:hypothetical protein